MSVEALNPPPHEDTALVLANNDGQQTQTEPEPTCRICLLGREESIELGNLIRPCLCRGTIAYVHITCLNRWRKESQSKTAFWACPQCRYRYRLVRTRAVGLASSPIVLGLSTITLFTLLVFFSSFIVSAFLPSDWISSPVRYSEDEYAMGAWYTYYTPSLMASSMWKVAFQALTEFLEDDSTRSHRHKRTKQASPAQTRIAEAREGVRTGPFKSTVHTRMPRPQEPEAAAFKEPTFFHRLLRRFMLGLSVLGSLSFVNFAWTSTYALQLFRPRRGRRDGARDGFTLVVLIFVLIGLARAMYKMYQLTQVLVKWLLKRAETAIVEVGSNEPIPLDQRINLTELIKEFHRWRLGLWAAVRNFRWTDIPLLLWRMFYQFFILWL